MKLGAQMWTLWTADQSLTTAGSRSMNPQLSISAYTIDIYVFTVLTHVVHNVLKMDGSGETDNASCFTNLAGLVLLSLNIRYASLWRTKTKVT
jgi:hypothetical protein